MNKMLFKKYDQIDDRVREYKELQIRKISMSDVSLVWKIAVWKLEMIKMVLTN